MIKSGIHEFRFSLSSSLYHNKLVSYRSSHKYGASFVYATNSTVLIPQVLWVCSSGLPITITKSIKTLEEKGTYRLTIPVDMKIRNDSTYSFSDIPFFTVSFFCFALFQISHCLWSMKSPKRLSCFFKSSLVSSLMAFCFHQFLFSNLSH